jgi:zinc protease
MTTSRLRFLILPVLAGALLASCAPRPVEAPPAPEPPAAPAPPEIPGLDAALLAERLDLDEAVRAGTLPNGLRYFILRNEEPQQRAELRLAVDAGSVLEDDDQQGLAHLLEHMAFNGTERFPEQELVNYLERIGMRFGPDLNAYTSFDETVYMLQVPTDDRHLLETGFVVLREWAGSITLRDEDIDAERGVVLEEWRLGRGAGARIRDQQLPVLLGGSRYAERLPIGRPEVIQHAPAEAVRRFYRDWYRPDLMAVVAVGDFEPDHIEEVIRENFSDLRTPAGAPERPTFDVPAHDETRFAIATDPEQTMTVVQILRKEPALQFETVRDFRDALIERLYLQMLNARLREITQRPGAPFLGGSALQGGFVRPIEARGLAAAAHEGRVVEAVRALLIEAERVRRHGFTESELTRATADLERAYRQAFQERDRTASRVHAGALVQLYLEGDAVPGIEREYELAQLLLPTITLAEVDARSEAVAGDDNRVVMVAAPERDDAPPPSEAELRRVLAEVRGTDIEPYEDAVLAEALLPSPPPPAGIVDESRYEDDGIVEWTLSNGVQVVIRPTDFRNDEVLFSAFSPGGLSLVDDADFRAGEHAAAAVRQGGLGEFSATDLERALAGQAVSVQPYIAAREEGLSGSASPEDLRTLMELIHLHFTAPRRDADAFAAHQERTITLLENRSASPMTVFSDTLGVILSGNHPRTIPPTPADVAALDVDRALAVYRDRFADASDFTFVFVGNVEPDSLAPLAKQYLATLPADPATREEARDLGARPPAGVVERTVYRGLEEQARVQLVFSGELIHRPEQFDWQTDEGAFLRATEDARRERFLLGALAEALRIRLREELREERGGVYGVGVSASADRLTGMYSISVGFGTDPARVDELVEAVHEQIRAFQDAGPDQNVIDRVLEAGRRGEETNLRTNRYWLSSLVAAYRHGESPQAYLYGEDLRQTLTPLAVRNAARRYIDPQRLVRVVLMPEDRIGG